MNFKPLEYNYNSHRPLYTLLAFLNRPWKFYLKMLFLIIIKQSAVWITPFLLAYIINSLTDPSKYSTTTLITYFSVTIILTFQNIFSHTYFISQISSATRDLEQTLRNALATRLQTLSIAFHGKTKTGKLHAKILRDVEQIQVFCMLLGDAGVITILSFIFSIIVTGIKEPTLLFFFLLLTPIVVGLQAAFRKKINKQNNEFRKEIEKMSEEVSEMINMIPVSRAHALEEETTKKMHSKFGFVNFRGRQLDQVNAFFASSSWVTLQLSMVVGLILLVWFCKRGHISVGEVALYQGMFSMIVMSVTQMLNLYPQFARGIESVRSIGEILECPDIEQNMGGTVVEKVDGNVAFDKISFSYEKEKGNALTDFSLKVKEGECVALVGESGSGKSTLMQLLIGFWRPDSGKILLDGIDMETIDMRTFRRFISTVPQEPVLFSGTIKENILHGLTGITDEILDYILELANLTEFIKILPKGVDTLAGEKGAMLSGGQRQRIVIARALARNPRILILDEATSALDVVSEKKVQEAINSAIKGRTTFVIAHRLSTIRNANKIVVMKEGKCVEMGSFEQLIEKKGVFFEMQKLQM